MTIKQKAAEYDKAMSVSGTMVQAQQALEQELELLRSVLALRDKEVDSLGESVRRMIDEVSYWRQLTEGYENIASGRMGGAPGTMAMGYQQIEQLKKQPMAEWIKERDKKRAENISDIDRKLAEIKQLAKDLF